jgi:O-antigen ligase
MLLKSGQGMRRVIGYGAIGAGAAAVAFYGLQLATGNFPLSLQQRLDVNEPAAAARSAQAGPLWTTVKAHPILGNGFGTTVTYRAVDPRRASESAEVTTDTFELGWLDTWLDIGLVGVLALLWWLRRLWKSGMAVARQSAVGAITVLAVAMLAVVHIFTPYLNHPLGLGLLLFLSALQPRTKL